MVLEGTRMHVYKNKCWLGSGIWILTHKRTFNLWVGAGSWLWYEKEPFTVHVSKIFSRGCVSSEVSCSVERPSQSFLTHLGPQSSSRSIWAAQCLPLCSVHPPPSLSLCLPRVCAWCPHGTLHPHLWGGAACETEPGFLWLAWTVAAAWNLSSLLSDVSPVTQSFLWFLSLFYCMPLVFSP